MKPSSSWDIIEANFEYVIDEWELYFECVAIEMSKCGA